MTGSHTDGVAHLKQFFAAAKLTEVEDTIAALYRMQAQKIGDYQITDWSVAGIHELLEQNDKEALYQVQKFFASSSIVRSVFDFTFNSMMADWLGCQPSEVLIEGPGLFVSRPNDVRLKYKWHSEAHYYPKRRRFVNIWFPLFGDRTLADGAMTVLPGSHTEHWDFAEYTGFDKDTEGKKNHFVQYEIPEMWLRDYRPYHCESQRGDLILFDRNIVHRSNINTTDKYAFSIVARAWTPKDDLTLSGTMAATPYGNDIGRANLVVDR